MIALRRRAADPLVPILIAVLAVVAVACGSTAPASIRPSARPSSAAGPSLTPVPGGPSATVAPAAKPPTTTSVDGFGTIFDALPASFPKLPGQVPADPGSGPTSGTFAVGMPVAEASATIVAALEDAGWSVDMGSPLEDGSVVLEATRPGTGCKMEVRFTPLSGTVSMSVLYGASCPFS